MMDLSTITFHDRFLDRSILDRTTIDIDLAIFTRSEGQSAIANYSIDGDIIMVMTDGMKLVIPVFFEYLQNS